MFLSGGGQETGQNAVGAVTEVCAHGKCCVRGRSRLQKRKSWMTWPAPHRGLPSPSPATTTVAHQNGMPWTGLRYSRRTSIFCYLLFGKVSLNLLWFFFCSVLLAVVLVIGTGWFYVEVERMVKHWQSLSARNKSVRPPGCAATYNVAHHLSGLRDPGERWDLIQNSEIVTLWHKHIYHKHLKHLT